jgi:hypothetical protein
VLIIFGFVWLLSETSTIVMPVILAAVLGAVAGPVVSRLERLRVPRIGGAILVLLGLVVIGALIFYLVFHGISAQAGAISEKANKSLDKIQGWLSDAGVDNAASAKKSVQEAAPDIRKTLLGGVATGIEGLKNLVFFLAFAVLSTLFVLKDGPVMHRFIDRHLGVPEPVANGRVARGASVHATEPRCAGRISLLDAKVAEARGRRRGGPRPCGRHARRIARPSPIADDGPMPRPVTAVGLAALALAAAGCGGGDSTKTTAKTATPTPAPTVDDAQVEQGIKDSLSTGSVKVTSAECPSDVQAKSGKTFTCHVSFSNGATGKATVTEISPNKFTYELKPGSVQVPGQVADTAVEKQLAAQGIPNATVDCPQNIIVKTGTTVSCNITGAQGAATSTVTFTFSDAEGTVDPSSVSTS